MLLQVKLEMPHWIKRNVLTCYKDINKLFVLVHTQWIEINIILFLIMLRT